MIILRVKVVKVPHTTHSYTKHSQKKVEKERQKKKAKCTSIKQQKAKACTKSSYNLYSVSSAEEAHKLTKDFGGTGEARVSSSYIIWAYTKTVDGVFRALWLATQSVDILRYSLIHLQFLRASDAKLT